MLATLLAKPFHATPGSVERRVAHSIMPGRLTCALGLLVGQRLLLLLHQLDIMCLDIVGWKWDDKTDRKAAAAQSLAVNARRIIKTCEWRWIITSQAHLDMHRERERHLMFSRV